MNDINPAACPLCGQSNDCTEVARKNDASVATPCWCIDAEFPPGLLDKVPQEARRKACICERCARGLALATEA